MNKVASIVLVASLLVTQQVSAGFGDNIEWKIEVRKGFEEPWWMPTNSPVQVMTLPKEGGHIPLPREQSDRSKSNWTCVYLPEEIVRKETTNSPMGVTRHVSCFYYGDLKKEKVTTQRNVLISSYCSPKMRRMTQSLHLAESDHWITLSCKWR
jgi:hypothetical protein